MFVVVAEFDDEADAAMAPPLLLADWLALVDDAPAFDKLYCCIIDAPLVLVDAEDDGGARADNGSIPVRLARLDASELSEASMLRAVVKLLLVLLLLRAVIVAYADVEEEVFRFNVTDVSLVWEGVAVLLLV